METSPTSTSLLDRKRGHGNTLQNRDKLVEAIVNKFITPNKKAVGNNATRLPSNAELSPIVRDTIKSVEDAENVLEVLPDLNLAAEIQIASILSSKDLITTALSYECNGDIDVELRAKMISIVKTYFNDDYKFNSYLYDILYDVLYRTGSYAVSIIPESAIDDIINGVSGTKVSTESLAVASKKLLQPTGILGPIKRNEVVDTKFGFEALTTNHNKAPSYDDLTISFKGDSIGTIRITDNPDIIKLKGLQRAVTERAISNTYRVANEDFDHTTLRDTDKRFYKNPLYSPAAISDIKPVELTSKPSVGRPLVQHYPSESVIPIHTPGDCKLQIGYLIILDNLGNPISKNDLINSNTAWAWVNGTADQKVKRDAAYGLGLTRELDTATNMTVSQLTNSFAELVENKVINAIKNGVYGDAITMSRPQDVYRIMLARALAKKNTQILYIPVEQMTYFAMDYNDFGIGRSLLDKNKMISTVRTALQFATLNGSILNSTRNLEYTIELDPADREAEKTIEDIKYRVMQSYNSNIPFTGTPDDMWAYMSNAGLSFNIQGNEFYPSTKIAVQDSSPDYKIPDQQTEEDFAKRHYRGLGLDPDLIISPDAIEFASQVTSKNLLATRRICKLQEKFNPFITQFIKTYIISDGIMLKELSVAIREHIGVDNKQPGLIGKNINLFLRNLTVSIPAPDTSMLASQMEQYNGRAEALDTILETFITDESLQDTDLDIDTNRARGIVKAYLMRQWLRENDVEPDLLKLFDDVEDRNSLVQSIANDTVDSATLATMLFNRIERRISTVAKNYDREVGGDTDSGFDNSDTDDSSADDSSFGDADADSGMDDGFGGDDSGDADLNEDEPTDENSDDASDDFTF